MKSLSSRSEALLLRETFPVRQLHRDRRQRHGGTVCKGLLNPSLFDEGVRIVGGVKALVLR
jgi:hypothetical protein